MKLSEFLSRFAEAFVDQHEAEICEALQEALSPDLDDIAAEVVELLDTTEPIKEEILNRM